MLREVTQDERDAMMCVGVFDINGNMPFHPGYTGIHRLTDGRFVQRDRAVYGTPEWTESQVEITADDDIATIERHLAGEEQPTPERSEPIAETPTPNRPWWKLW